MADYAIPKNGVAYIFYGCLVSQADTKLFKSGPTLAAGDFKVSIDGGAFANLATLPTNTPGTYAVKFSMSAGEMTGDNILVVASDAAGAEWCDQCWNIQTSARGVADLAFPTTSGRSIDVSAGGEVGVDWANVGSPTTTLNLSGTTIATTQKVDVETIKTNPVVNAGTVTFPTTATLASTTNITAGTITTATNLTNAPTAGDLTAAMKASVNAEVDTAISDAALATAANLATVAGYLDTEIASILADTNELQTDWTNGGRLDLIVDAILLDTAEIGAAGAGLTALATQTSVNDIPTNAELATALAAADDAVLAAVGAIPSATQNADALLNRDMGAVSDTNDRSPLNALRAIRNKWFISGTTQTITKEDDTTEAWTTELSTSAGADPITGSDPA